MPTGVLLPLPRLGLPTPTNGDRLFFYEPGTTSKRNTYTTSALSVANANPLVASSAGLFTAIYLDPALAYKLVFARAGSDDPPSSPVFTEDAIPAHAAASDLDVIATAGEALAAGDVVYLSDGQGSRTPGRWYKTDADTSYTADVGILVGVAPSAIASGANGTVRITGRVTGLSGLTIGAAYYVSGTAGALTDTAPAFVRFVGVADSTTTLVIAPNPKARERFVVASVTTTYTALATDDVLICTSGTFTITLPTAVGNTGKRFEIKNVGSGTITVDGNGSETIDGDATITVAQWFSFSLVSDGANWVIV